MPELTVIIPARREEYVSNTVADACANMEADTRILVVLDGDKAAPPIPQHPKVDILVLPGSVGQRAATNMGVAMADSRYVMKADGHIAFGKGFDRILIESAKELGPNVVQIPAQRNLHVYSRVCEDCGNHHDQAPVIDKCKKCQSPRLRKELVWKPRNRPLSTNWVLNHELEFTYASNKQQVGDICDVMSSLGACMFMERDWFIEIEGFDEGHGSWGAFGAEAALKTWTAGGRHVVNKRTTFAHWFRVGGQNFPYPITGSQQQFAKEYARQLWRSNGWRKQIHPLRWVVEKFWSELNNDKVTLWTKEQRDALPRLLPARIASAGESVSAISPSGDGAHLGLVSHLPGESALSVGLVSGAEPRVPANAAKPEAAIGAVVVGAGGQVMPVRACGLGGVDGANPGTSQRVDLGRNECEVGGVAAGRIAADDVVELMDGPANALRNGVNEPREHESVGEFAPAVDPRLPVSTTELGSAPQPAAGGLVDGDLAEQFGELLAVDVTDGEILGVSHTSASCAVVGLGPGGCDQHLPGPSSLPSKTPTKSIIYYSDVRPDPQILEACRRTIERAGLPIIAVTLKPIDWPAARNIVVPFERGYAAMFKQILIGLIAADTDIVYFAEHDLLYSPESFAFTPPRADTYYYQDNVWKVPADGSRALSYRCNQTSGLSGYRRLLIEHYVKRVAHVEQHGYSRNNGFEPGTRKVRHGGFDDVPYESWQAAVPNVDIRHEACLTPSRWRKEDFRNQKYTEGWTEADSIPGWGPAKGLLQRVLQSEAVA